MIMKKTFLRVMAGYCLILIMFLPCLPMQGQLIARNAVDASHSSSPPINKIQPLSIGDPLPSIFVSNVLNFSSSTLSTAEFNDRLLILDFMATGCKSCIEVMPKFDSLQKRFGDQLEIVLVTYEKKERVKTFLDRNKIGKQIKFVFVTEDSLLKSLFPHEYISHVVWVYKGNVKAITRTQYVNAANIQTVLDGKNVNWPIKKDITEYDYSQPLFSLNEANIPEFSIPSQKYYTAFTGFLPGITRRYSEKIDSAAQVIRVSMVNYPIIDMYLKALGQQLRFPPSYMILEAEDKTRYVYDPKTDYRDEWRLDNNYSYEGSFPITLSKEFRGKKIKQDLDFYLGLDGRIEKRKIMCLVLEQSGSNHLLKTASNKSSPEKPELDLPRQTSISNLIYRLNHTWYSSPVLDQTKFQQKMYLELRESSFESIEKLKVELSRYGLNLREEENEIEMFVLTEKRK